MKKKTRKVLFLLFFIIFLLLGPIIVLYSQGYRFDWKNKKITQTGGLFLRVEPKVADVFIDGKFVKKTDFLFGSVLIENLLPRKYQVEVKKERYFPWKKELEIKEKEVCEAKSIVLIPENLDYQILTKVNSPESSLFYFSPDQKKIVWKEEEENGWSLKLYDLDKNLKIHLLNQFDISPKGGDLLDLKWADNSKEIQLNVLLKEEKRSFVLNLEKTPPLLTTVKISPPEEKIIASYLVNETKYFIDASGNLFKNQEKLTDKPLSLKEEGKYQLRVFSDYIFLEGEGTLYLFQPDSRSFEEIFRGIKGWKISPAKRKLVYFSDWEIWIFFLHEKMSQPRKKIGQHQFLLRLSEKIRDVFWLNEDYLIFNAGDKIKVAETDDRDKINIFNIGEFKDPKIFFNEVDKKVYVLTEGNLFVSKKIIP